MSVAVLPSAPLPYEHVTMLSAPSPSKRPKLSLNTSSAVPLGFGKKATSLRLETLSATSPTLRNTFSNAHEDVTRLRTPGARSHRPVLSSLSISSSPISTVEEPSTPVAPGSSHSSVSSAASTSTTDSLPIEIPYKLAFNTTSILSNGPLPRTRSVRKQFSQSKPMFPTAKRVAFKAPLEEEIHTERYTFRNSDIESSSSTISTLELTPSDRSKAKDQVDDEASHLGEKPEGDLSVKAPTMTGEKREADEDEDEGDSDTCPATPVAGRRKRDREWVWTLGPVKSDEPAATDVHIADDEPDESARQSTQ
ncbi:hypothetical protein B0A48_02455 [Cryoendolithus antarcticus]|uniref:Uncharacterized protein n=1 Tax=Cryoendolithus antarcticus TaxID=1507870 RepID=A0A1V8TP08_9PEZI|nr:hypothetical protein B0A48_02455 [Cryoendolithus antarcticus]